MSKADVEEFEDEIRVGGFYRNNARVIKAVSKMILEQINGLLDFIYSLSF
jgi:endonuclease III